MTAHWITESLHGAAVDGLHDDSGVAGPTRDLSTRVALLDRAELADPRVLGSLGLVRRLHARGDLDGAAAIVRDTPAAELASAPILDQQMAAAATATARAAPGELRNTLLRWINPERCYEVLRPMVDSLFEAADKRTQEILELGKVLAEAQHRDGWDRAPGLARLRSRFAARLAAASARDPSLFPIDRSATAIEGLELDPSAPDPALHWTRRYLDLVGRAGEVPSKQLEAHLAELEPALSMTDESDRALMARVAKFFGASEGVNDYHRLRRYRHQARQTLWAWNVVSRVIDGRDDPAVVSLAGPFAAFRGVVEALLYLHVLAPFRQTVPPDLIKSGGVLAEILAGRRGFGVGAFYSLVSHKKTKRRARSDLESLLRAYIEREPGLWPLRLPDFRCHYQSIQRAGLAGIHHDEAEAQARVDELFATVREAMYGELDPRSSNRSVVASLLLCEASQP